MNSEVIKKILSSKKKPKQKIKKLVKEVKKNKGLIKDLKEYFKTGTKSEKGYCIEVLEYVSKDDPVLVAPHLDFIIENLNFDASRVKWECSRIIGNLAEEHPKKAAKAIPKLMSNTNDDSTVVRWSTAFALTRIAEHNKKKKKELLKEFKKIIKKEDNNGVKNVYKKTLKKK